MESLKDTSVEYETKLFNAFSDSNIEGEFDNELYRITTEDLVFKNGIINTYLTIEIKEKKVQYKHPLLMDRSKFTKGGFYHGGGIADEILELSSLFLRRRLMRQNRDISYYMKDFLKDYGIEGWADESLISAKSNLNELYGWFELIEGLNEKYHLKFMFATKMYYNAISIIEDKPDLAYLYLISSIEVFLKDFEINISIEDITAHNNKLKTILESINDENLGNDLEKQILKLKDFISKKFEIFIMDHIEEDFWNHDEDLKGMEGQELLEAYHHFVEKEEMTNREILTEKGSKKLKGVLSKIYNQRSYNLHSGELFQPHIFDLIEPNCKKEIPRHDYYYAGDRKWEYKDFIPYPHFFERLVNHVLKNFLIKNQKD